MFHFYWLKACVGCSFNYHCLVWACELVCVEKCWSRCLMLCFMWKLILALKKLSALIVGFVWKFPENHLKWIHIAFYINLVMFSETGFDSATGFPMRFRDENHQKLSMCTRFWAPPWERLNGPLFGPGRKGAAKCSAEAPGDATPRFCGRLVGKCWKSGGFSWSF